MSKLKVAPTLTEKQLKVLSNAKNQELEHLVASFGDYGFTTSPSDDFSIILEDPARENFEPVFVSYYNSFEPIRMMADARIKPDPIGSGVDPKMADVMLKARPNLSLKNHRLEQNRKYGWVYKEKYEHSVKDPTNKILPHFTAYVPLLINGRGVKLHIFNRRVNGNRSKYFRDAPNTVMSLNDPVYYDDAYLDCNHQPKAWFKGLQQTHETILVKNTPIMFDSSYIHTTNNWTKGGAASGIQILKIIFRNKHLEHAPDFLPWEFLDAYHTD